MVQSSNGNDTLFAHTNAAALPSALLRVASVEWRSEAGMPRPTEAEEFFGTFSGLPAQLALLADGRTARLLAPLSFAQADGTAWPVPAGIEIDGASIPRFLWSLIGGPFEGRYRDASIVHDHYCVVRTRPWQDTHRVFHDAMRCSGESPIKAKIMYYAVYRFGPRWGATEAAAVAPPFGPADAAILAADAEAIHVQNLTLPEIQALANARDAAAHGESMGDTALDRARRLIITSASGTGDDVEAVAREAATLPASLLDEFETKGIRIVACRNSVTDFETHLRGKRPRGWPPGTTWDSALAAGFPDNRRVVVTTTMDAGGWSDLLVRWRNSPAERPEADDAPIGTAEFAGDGSIVLDLRAEGEGGTSGHAVLAVRPGEAGYSALAEHVAGGAAETALRGPVPFKPMK